MLIVFLLLNYVFLTNQVTLYQCDQNTTKFDFSCYFTKACQDVCPKFGCYLNENHRRLSLLNDQKDEVMAVNGLYRPRSALARALYEKQRNDRLLEEFDQTEVSVF